MTEQELAGMIWNDRFIGFLKPPSAYGETIKKDATHMELHPFY